MDRGKTLKVQFSTDAQFSEFARLGSLFDTRLHYGFILALVLVFIMYILMEKTVWGGYEIRVIGNNKNAAKYAGIKIDRSIIGGSLYEWSSGRYSRLLRSGRCSVQASGGYVHRLWIYCNHSCVAGRTECHWRFCGIRYS